MAFMEWSDKYIVGCSELEEQHRQLFILVKQLHAMVVNGDNQSAVGKALDELINYTIEHFAAEEQLFKKNQYPQFDKHKQEHDDLIQRFLVLRENLCARKITGSFEVLEFLHDWLNKHTVNADLEYAAYANSRKG